MGRREYVWTHDLAGVQNGVIGHGFVDLWHDERLDQSETFGFEIAADNPKAFLLAADVELSHRGRSFYVAELEDSRRGAQTTISVEAEALWYRLGDFVVPGSLTLSGDSPAAGLERILREAPGWTAGPSTTTSTQFSMEQQDKSVLALLRAWAKITGTSLVFDTAGRAVSLVDARGAELGLAFRYGRNLTDVRRRTKPPDLTRLYPYGADGLSVAGINGGEPFVENFAYYTDQGIDLSTARELYTRSRVWSDTSFLIDTELLVAAEARLAAESDALISYELAVVDLSEITGSAEDVAVADRVRVYDPSFDADVRATVVRVHRYFLQPWRNQIELSTILDPIRDANSSSSRGSRSSEWVQFVGPIRADYVIRNDGDYLTNRIPLAFREGGRANFHLELFATGVGAGTMDVTVYDAENGDEVQRRIVSTPYTNGALIRFALDWAREEMVGHYDFRVRVTTTASGGPSQTNGVNIATDPNNESSFYIMAQGAIQETPVATNSQRFDYVSNAAQQFTVPEGVTEVEVEVVGGGVSLFSTPTVSGGGGGARIIAKMAVVPGAIYDVYAPSSGGHSGAADQGWPGGGPAGLGTTGTGKFGGGGYGAVIPSGGALTAALIVAGGGGGNGTGQTGGDGGFTVGQDGTTGAPGGKGATQFAGGAAGTGNEGNGAAGSFGTAGGGGGPVGVYGTGGGGGGWYGGGGGASHSSPAQGGGGGGGSGMISAAMYDITAEVGYNGTDGYVEFRWETPA